MRLNGGAETAYLKKNRGTQPKADDTPRADGGRNGSFWCDFWNDDPVRDPELAGLSAPRLVPDERHVARCVDKNLRAE